MNKKNIISLIILDFLVMLAAIALLAYRYYSINFKPDLRYFNEKTRILDNQKPAEAKQIEMESPEPESGIGETPEPPMPAEIKTDIKSETRNIGFTYKNSKANTVEIIGSFNDWVPQALNKNKTNSWSINLKIAPGEYGYNYLVDGKPIRDPNNFKICDKGKGFPSSYLLVKPLREESKKSEKK